ncbi:hypothetical protein F2P81_018782 [Scophthalmus maximus]|uniref:Uncharacterized protein n=1 Tax=Scophthalmus maximus TaxID=52904 RepID=A0A6A4S934_SCOMX|nr:hypothetical protein F2P81_018782 [Scophthalmus maximus]
MLETAAPSAAQRVTVDRRTSKDELCGTYGAAALLVPHVPQALEKPVDVRGEHGHHHQMITFSDKSTLTSKSSVFMQLRDRITKTPEPDPPLISLLAELSPLHSGTGGRLFLTSRDTGCECVILVIKLKRNSTEKRFHADDAVLYITDSPTERVLSRLQSDVTVCRHFVSIEANHQKLARCYLELNDFGCTPRQLVPYNQPPEVPPAPSVHNHPPDDDTVAEARYLITFDWALNTPLWSHHSQKANTIITFDICKNLEIVQTRLPQIKYINEVNALSIFSITIHQCGLVPNRSQCKASRENEMQTLCQRKRESLSEEEHKRIRDRLLLLSARPVEACETTAIEDKLYNRGSWAPR